MGLVTFRDARRVEWQVCEVSRLQIDAHRERRQAERQLRPRRSPWSLLPGLEGGWLSFESWWQKRRLTPYPTDWRELPTSELERLCAQATVVPEPGARAEAPRRVTPLLPDDRDPGPTGPAPGAHDDVPGAAALRRAIRACCDDGLSHLDVLPALRLYCAAFRTRGSEAAQMVVALKALFASTPEIRRLDARCAGMLRSQLVSAGIEEYYSPTHDDL